MNKAVTLFVLLCLGTIILFSCATANRFDPAAPLVSIERAEPKELSKYGVSYETNPFLEPRSLIRGKFNEFIIIKVNLNLPSETNMSITVSCTGPDGKETGKPYSRQMFEEYWLFYSSENDNPASVNRRNNTIGKYTFFSFEGRESGGVKTRYIPVIGPNPILRPSNIDVTITAGGSVFIQNLVID